MQIELHDMRSLFAQLGLPSDDSAIDAYIAAHRPLAPDLDLADAPFWSEAQAEFLREELLVDADWASAIDDLNASLR